MQKNSNDKACKTKTCPKCKTEFSCSLQPCWCGNINISDEKLEEIKAKYNDCLCPKCLNAFASPPTQS